MSAEILERPDTATPTKSIPELVTKPLKLGEVFDTPLPLVEQRIQFNPQHLQEGVIDRVRTEVLGFMLPIAKKDKLIDSELIAADIALSLGSIGFIWAATSHLEVAAGILFVSNVLSRFK